MEEVEVVEVIEKMFLYIVTTTKVLNFMGWGDLDVFMGQDASLSRPVRSAALQGYEDGGVHLIPAMP